MLVAFSMTTIITEAILVLPRFTRSVIAIIEPSLFMIKMKMNLSSFLEEPWIHRTGSVMSNTSKNKIRTFVDQLKLKKTHVRYILDLPMLYICWNKLVIFGLMLKMNLSN